ncbi:MAG TPA: energy transducer TonB [Burkholderiales bacterium]|nr:energy transducer TonB [Burkholderiales bacterium]
MAGTRTLTLVCLSASLGACAPLPTAQKNAWQEPSLPPPPYIIALGDYKRLVADRIVQVSAETYSAPMPEMMKSIVVLEITVDRLGAPLGVSVYRSNGYRELEKRALASVVKAAPFAPPAPALLQGAQSVSFLETFLFRDDDLFQVRSLVPDTSEAAGLEKLF